MRSSNTRLSMQNVAGASAASAQLLSPIVLDLIDSYGIDAGAREDVWFEFFDDRLAAHRISKVSSIAD